jgi:hypothetical protein
VARPSLPLVLAAALLALTLAGCNGDDGGAATTTTGPPPTESTTTTEPPVEAGEQVFVYLPSVGDCFDRRQLESAPDQRGQTDIVLLLECDLPHRYETFSVLEPPDAGNDFPGEKALEDLARASCVTAFEAFVGRPYVVSELEVGWYLPTASAWGQGARAIGCHVYDLDGDKLVGTMRGSGR